MYYAFNIQGGPLVEGYSLKPLGNSVNLSAGVKTNQRASDTLQYQCIAILRTLSQRKEISS